MSRFTPLLLLALAMGGVLNGSAAAQVAAGSGEQKRVLAIYSTRRDSLLADAAERVVPARLEDKWGARLDYYTEFIDPARFPDANYDGFADLIRRKYPALHPDVVLAFEDAAIDFVTRHRDALFPSTPVVFFTRNASVARLANSTGVVEPIDFAHTVELVTALQPDVREIFVVSGASARDQAYKAAARAQFARFEPRLKFTYLSGLPIAELDARLASLPEHAVVYPLLVSQSGDNQFFKPHDITERIGRTSNRPVYAWHEEQIGDGFVGGSVLQLEPGLGMVADSANRVLAGEAADAVPIAQPRQQAPRVDARALRRWGISAANVPAGFAIAFQEPGIWERYRGYLLGIAVIVIAQSLLIGGLLVQARRRKTAEARLRQSQAALKQSYERIRDIGGRLLTAQEAERSRIARDLHDDITQQMAVLAVDLHSVGGTEHAREHLARIAQSVHDLSHRLHPEALRALGLTGALRSLQQEHVRAGLPVTLEYDVVPKTLPPEVTVCVFRVVQEALQNAAKYSRAKTVSVELRYSNNMITLTIADDGIGFDVEKEWGRGLGLISIQERVEAAGGQVKVESSPGQGARFVVRVPDQMPAVAVVA